MPSAVSPESDGDRRNERQQDEPIDKRAREREKRGAIAKQFSERAD